MKRDSVLLAFILSSVALFLQTLTVMLLWNWFGAKAFQTPKIGYMTAAGLMLLVELVRGGGTIKSVFCDDHAAEVSESGFNALCLAAGILAAGFLCSFFV